ncbi:MAG: hypothetical protein ABGX71_06355 [Methyloprofundus sp.]|uniref:hypothetical protein n=1 Tax=Methyloprofundus sp. TaxID=2020875 RepID=UPI002615D23C|nr:hypothetical protein [Methyloprofundus sp.]
MIRRSQNWLSKHFYLDNQVHFESRNLTLSVEEIYHCVQNEEILDYYKNKVLAMTCYLIDHTPL